jgi:flavodoxin
MKKIMIFYHSGAGATKMVGEILQEKLAESFEVERTRVDPIYDYDALKGFDFLIFGFPVYGFEASPSMQEFVDGIPALEQPIKCGCTLSMPVTVGNRNAQSW